MSDTTPAPPADAPPADAPAPDAATDATDAPVGDDFYTGWPEKAVAEHRRLKDENVRYKERFRPYEDVFSTLHQDDANFMLGFIDAFRSGNAAEVARYQPALTAYFDSLTPAEQREAKQAIAEAAAAPDDEYDPFDKTKLEQIIETRLDERDRVRREEQAQRDHEENVKRIGEEIAASAKKLADEHNVPEWADTTSGLYRALVSVAQDVEGAKTLDERMAKAAEALSGELDKRGQALLKAKSAAVGEAPAPSGGTEPSGQTVPRTLRDATESALRRLEAMQQGPG